MDTLETLLLETVLCVSVTTISTKWLSEIVTEKQGHVFDALEILEAITVKFV